MQLCFPRIRSHGGLLKGAYLKKYFLGGGLFEDLRYGRTPWAISNNLAIAALDAMSKMGVA